MLLTRVAIRKWASAAVGTAIFAAPVATNAQAVVRTVIVGERSVPETERVHLSRFADFAVQNKIAVGTALQVGDLLTTAAPETNVLLEIGCPANGRTVFRFSGAFRVVVLPPRPDVPCVLQLLGGGVDVMAEEATEINAGGVVLGSKGTQYAVHLRRTEGGPVCEGIVYENALLIRTGLKEIPLSTSRSWVYNFATETGQQGAISERVLMQSAMIAARFDVARLRADKILTPAKASEIKRQESELLALHIEVLKAPANKDARLKLGTKQETVGSLDGARYNLHRVGRVPMKMEGPRDKGTPPQVEAKVAKPQASSRTKAAVEKAPGVASSMKVMTAAEPAARALELVRGGKPAEAVALVRPRVDASSATARDYYALAEAYRALQDRAAARSAAERALAFPEAATALSAAEIETLRAILGGGQ
jgi:hypothetical protein